MIEEGNKNPIDPRIQPAPLPAAPAGPAFDRYSPNIQPISPAEAQATSSIVQTQATEEKDAFREIVETVVFVVVLVLLLKAFMAEAFVIPTGSMATTLLGYNREIECPQCGHRFPLNLSKQVDPQEAQDRQEVTGCTCENCGLFIDSRNSRQFNSQKGPSP